MTPACIRNMSFAISVMQAHNSCGGILFCEVDVTWKQLVVVCHTQKQGEVIANITSLWIHQNVPVHAKYAQEAEL